MSTSEAASPASGGTDTHCPYCALQCAMTLTASGRAFPTNRGGLRRKGRTSATL